ncbi:outer membrane immunogenic protein [Devosia crocina]|uniref:Outer membrane immunogenic protein n=1 Tax=Devosia crocina TaxID=429728 RepID=A0A1I7MWW8_9HYPH|nr:outer membrane protein [Devosia crocina]SFV26868.1 outer membrane immunogenic protein [Devosia crocina]
MTRTAIALSALLALTASAAAADLGWSGGAAATSPMFSPTSVTDWTGFYAGVNGGYSWGTTTNTPAIGTAENNSSGWLAGGQVGYNVDMGGLVIGAEADMQWTNLAYSEPLGALGSFESRLDWLGTARVRAGGTFGQVMPYVTLGAAFAGGKSQVENDGVSTFRSAGHFGWTAGVGIEAKATENISVKAEYLYVDLGEQAYAGLPGGARTIGQKANIIRAGVNYKF